MPELISTEAKPLVLHSVSLHVVAVMTCVCGCGPLVITGTSDVATCTGCAARYMVSKIEHQPQPDGTMKTNVEVGKLSDLALPRAAAATPFGRRNH